MRATGHTQCNKLATASLTELAGRSGIARCDVGRRSLEMKREAPRKTHVSRNNRIGR